MFCGAGSLPRDEDDEPTGPPTTKGPSKKSKPNPYSTRGLDKFSTVLEELGAKRERIMARTGSQGVAMVRFMYENSKDWIPIVVRPKKAADDKRLLASSSTSAATKVEDVSAKKSVQEKKGRKRISYYWRPSYYRPLVVVLILMCLVAFGRVFAICCTCMWWYMVPTFRDWSAKKSVTRKKAVVKFQGLEFSL